MFKIIRKSDIVLFFVLLAIGVALSVPGFASGSSSSSSQSSTVEISVAGESFGSYDMNEDKEINIQRGTNQNKVIIKDKTVQMIEASCHNHDCIKQGTISKVNQSIICLPNRVVVRIVAGSAEGQEDSSEGGDVDVISG